MNKLNTILIAFVLFFLSSCFEDRSDVWVVGTSADNPPYEFMQNGDIVGFDVDFIIEVGKHLGKKIEFKNMEFHNLFASLANKDIDFIVAGVSVTKERKARADFSIPYTYAKIAVLYRGRDDFRHSSDLIHKHIGAQLGTIWNLIAYNLSIKHNFRVTTLSNNLKLIDDLRSGLLDAVVMEEHQADKFIAIYPELTKFVEPELSSSFAIAMPKDSPHKNNIDHTIKALKSNGTLQTLSKKWGIIGAN